jgi:hypothetical protein
VTLAAAVGLLLQKPLLGQSLPVTFASRDVRLNSFGGLDDCVICGGHVCCVGRSRYMNVLNTVL